MFNHKKKRPSIERNYLHELATNQSRPIEKPIKQIYLSDRVRHKRSATND